MLEKVSQPVDDEKKLRAHYEKFIGGSRGFISDSHPMEIVITHAMSWKKQMKNPPFVVRFIRIKETEHKRFLSEFGYNRMFTASQIQKFLRSFSLRPFNATELESKLAKAEQRFAELEKEQLKHPKLLRSSRQRALVECSAVMRNLKREIDRAKEEGLV